MARQLTGVGAFEHLAARSFANHLDLGHIDVTGEQSNMTAIGHGARYLLLAFDCSRSLRLRARGRLFCVTTRKSKEHVLQEDIAFILAVYAAFFLANMLTALLCSLALLMAESGLVQHFRVTSPVAVMPTVEGPAARGVATTIR